MTLFVVKQGGLSLESLQGPGKSLANQASCCQTGYARLYKASSISVLPYVAQFAQASIFVCSTGLIVLITRHN